MFSANYTGGTVVYPLIFDNPADDEAFKNIESTFMLGDALKISPVMDYSYGNRTNFTSYFPEGVWRDVFDYSKVVNATGMG